MKNIDLNELLDELRGLNQHNIGSWPTWAYVGALVLASLLIIGAGTWYFVSPQQDALEQARQTESELKQSFVIKQKKVANLGQYKTQLATMQQQFGALLQQLPSQTEVPSLLNDISQMRLASGLEEELFKPSEEVPKDFYAVLPNDLIVTGSYHELARFVSGVASLSRIVTIEDVEIEAVGDGGASGDLRMSVSANTYRYLDDTTTAGADQ